VNVPQTSQAPLGVVLAEPRLADVTPRALPVTTEPWAVPAGFLTSDPDTVPPSADEAAASAAYRARQRRHAGIARGGRPQPRHSSASKPSAGGPGFRAPEEGKGEASAGDPGGPAAGPRGSDASTLAGSAEGAQRAQARESGARAARDGRGGLPWRNDYSGAAGDGFGDGWAPESGGGAATSRYDREDRCGGTHGRHADTRDGRAWPAACPADGRGHMAPGYDGPIWTYDGGQGHRPPLMGPGAPPRQWGIPDRWGQLGCRSAPRALGCRVRQRRWRDGAARAGRHGSCCDFYPEAAGRRSLSVVVRIVDAPYPGDGHGLARLAHVPAGSRLVRVRPVHQLGRDGAPRGHRCHGRVRPHWARLRRPLLCLESPRTRSKRFHAALWRVLRATGRPVHAWEYRSHD